MSDADATEGVTSFAIDRGISAFVVERSVAADNDHVASTSTGDPSVDRGDAYYVEIRKSLDRRETDASGETAITEEERDRKWMRETLHGKAVTYDTPSGPAQTSNPIEETGPWYPDWWWRGIHDTHE